MEETKLVPRELYAAITDAMQSMTLSKSKLAFRNHRNPNPNPNPPPSIFYARTKVSLSANQTYQCIAFCILSIIKITGRTGNNYFHLYNKIKKLISNYVYNSMLVQLCFNCMYLVDGCSNRISKPNSKHQ